MPATEDSVLTSLNELRRLRKERRKKGHSARSAGGNASSQKPAAAAYDRMGDQVTPPPRSDLGVGAKGMRAGIQSGMQSTARAASAGHGFAGPAAATWDAPVDPAAFARMAQPKSSAKPAIVVAVVLLAAAGAGYMKLQNDTQALLDEKNANIRRVEDARAQAVEAAAQAERQAQAKLKACEAKAARSDNCRGTRRAGCDRSRGASVVRGFCAGKQPEPAQAIGGSTCGCGSPLLHRAPSPLRFRTCRGRRSWTTIR